MASNEESASEGRRECEVCGDEFEELTLTPDGHPEGVNKLACEDCAEVDRNPNQKAGTEERTEDSVARVRYMDLARGELVRYLEPGDLINLPADRVEVEVLD